MNYESVQAFVTVSRYRSVSMAAEILFASQSTISHRLKQLEDEVGFTLLNRQRGLRSISLTPDGERFYPLAQRWLALETSMKSLNDDSFCHELQIGLLASISDMLLKPFLLKIAQDPSIRLRIRTLHTDEIYRLLDVGDLDIGFASFPVHYENINARPIFREPMVVISSVSSSLPAGVLSTADLDISKEIYCAWDPYIVQWHRQWIGQSKEYFARVDSPNTIISFLQAADAWVLCPMSIAEEYLKQGMYKINTLAENPPDRICYFLTRKDKSDSAYESIKLFESEFDKWYSQHRFSCASQA